MRKSDGSPSNLQAIRFDDSEPFSAALKRVNLEVLQTGRGPFRANYAVFTTGICDVQVGSINRPIFARGSSDPNRVALLLDLYESPQWSWFGEAMESDSVALCSGGSELLIRTAAATRWGFVSASRDELAQFAQTFYGQDLPRPQRGPASITAGAEELAMMHDLLISSFAACQRAGPQQMPLGPALDRTLCRLMVEILLGETGGVRAEAARAQRVVRRVHYFMAGHLEGAVSLDEISRAIGVKRETLLSIFRDYVGVDPIQYLKIMRLNQVNKALRRAQPGSIAIGDIARAWGFSYLNGFTRQFTEFYGKSPSRVLRQQARLSS